MKDKSQSKDTEKKPKENYKEILQRVQAEFENYQKRMQKEHENYVKFAKIELIKELLTILDDLEMAIKNKESDSFMNGIELLYTKFSSLLEKEGVKKIQVNGEFNPELHEALLQEHSEQKEGTILKELQKGYMIYDKVLRHTKVVVSTGGKKNDKDNRN
ncbi:MAG: nucleotide exchange factor GrpE [Nanoarchaeota archaeon]